MKTATDTSLSKTAHANAARRATSANYSAQITSILVPIDFSNASTKALKYAIALARQYGAKITLLFVTELPEIVGIFQLLLNDDEIGGINMIAILDSFVTSAVMSHWLHRRLERRR